MQLNSLGHYLDSLFLHSTSTTKGPTPTIKTSSLGLCSSTLQPPAPKLLLPELYKLEVEVILQM